MRGRQMKAAPERKISVTQRPPLCSHAEIGDASICSSVAVGPPAIPQTTNIPTATKANNLTTASTAIAMTMPWCRSFESRFRVPKRTVKIANPTATHAAAEFRSAASHDCPSAVAKTENDSVTDCNCNAIYGVAATTARTVTITPSCVDLPKRLEIRSAIDVIRCARPIRTSRRRTHHQPIITIVGPR